MLKTSRRKIVTGEKKEECPLEGRCRSEDIIYKYVVTTTGHPQKASLGTS